MQLILTTASGNFDASYTLGYAALAEPPSANPGSASAVPMQKNVSRCLIYQEASRSALSRVHEEREPGYGAIGRSGNHAICPVRNIWLMSKICPRTIKISKFVLHESSHNALNYVMLFSNITTGMY